MLSYDRMLLLLLCIAVTLPVVVKAKARETTGNGVPSGFSIPSSTTGYVSIKGDVLHPGIYPISAKSLTNDVIKMAVPRRPLKTISAASSNALPLKNGAALHLSVARDGEGTVSVGMIPVGDRIVMGIPLDLAAMGKDDFEAIPGIGPVMAERIVAYRQNNGGAITLHELLYVEGIGEKTFNRIKKYF